MPNNTSFQLSEITSQEELFTVRNNYRQRTIKVYKHPTAVDNVISVGIPFGKTLDDAIICDEPKTVWKREINQLPDRRYFIQN